MRRFRTRSKPRHYRLLSLELHPTLLFKRGKYVYWNPQGAQYKAGEALYRFDQKAFAHQVGAYMLDAPKNKMYRDVKVIVQLQKPQKDLLAMMGSTSAVTVIPCRILRRYQDPKGKAAKRGKAGKFIDIAAHPGKTFSVAHIGGWGMLDLGQLQQPRLTKGRLVVSVTQPGSARARTSVFYKLSLPGAVLQQYKTYRATQPTGIYLVRFRIVGLSIQSRYPARNWMPHPHGGFRHYRMIGTLAQ